VPVHSPTATKKCYILGMSKIIARIIVGLLVAVALKLISSLLLPTTITESESFDTVISLCYAACIIVPCAIYFIKTPPGTNNKGERVG
jgi:hypothetical protein